MSAGRRAYNILRGYIGREWDRIQGVETSAAEKELLDYQAPVTVTKNVNSMPPEDRATHARRLLGVTESAAFPEIRKAYERLKERSAPSNFPEGSAEATQAAEIHRRVNWAYQTLTADVDTTEKRFGTLEIE